MKSYLAVSISLEFSQNQSFDYYIEIKGVGVNGKSQIILSRVYL